MSGIFSVGVLSALGQDSLAWIDSVYGISVGALNGAYFLSGQFEEGKKIYFEDLSSGFVNKKDGLKLMFEKIFLGPRDVEKAMAMNFTDAMNISYLRNVITKRRPLNQDAIAERGIPLHIKLFNQAEGRPEYHTLNQHIRVHQDGINVLMAASSMPPYSDEYEMIQGDPSLDGNLSEVLGLEDVFRRHSGQKIIYVLNRRPIKKYQKIVRNAFEGYLNYCMYGRGYFWQGFDREEQYRRDVEELKKHENVLFLMPEKQYSASGTTNPRILRKTYRQGLASGIRARRFLGLKN